MIPPSIAPSGQARQTGTAGLRLWHGRGLLLACLAATALAGPTRSEETSGKIELKTVKYDQLARAVRGLEGKVVVLDLWATWCIPCKKEFHHLVELHKKYGKDGLVAVSVSLDTPDEAAAALKFLQKQGAAFPNYLIDESEEVWQPRLRFKGPPAVFVFDRQGYRAGKFTNDDPKHQFTYDRDVEPLVKKLLAQKK